MTASENYIIEEEIKKLEERERIYKKEVLEKRKNFSEKRQMEKEERERKKMENMTPEERVKYLRCREYHRIYYQNKKGGKSEKIRLAPLLSEEEKVKRKKEAQKNYNRKYWEDHKDNEEWRDMMREKARLSNRKYYERLRAERKENEGLKEKIKVYESKFGPIEVN